MLFYCWDLRRYSAIGWRAGSRLGTGVKGIVTAGGIPGGREPDEAGSINERTLVNLATTLILQRAASPPRTFVSLPMDR